MERMIIAPIFEAINGPLSFTSNKTTAIPITKKPHPINIDKISTQDFGDLIFTTI